MLLIVHYCRSVISKFEVGGDPTKLCGDCCDSYICISLSDVLFAKGWTESGNT